MHNTPSDEFANIWNEILQQSTLLANKISTNDPTQPLHGISNLIKLGLTYRKAVAAVKNKILAEPSFLLQQYQTLQPIYAQLFQQLTQHLQNKTQPKLDSTQLDDRRFKDEAWSKNPIFNFIKQSYLITAQYITETISYYCKDLDNKTANQVKFCTRLLLETLSPTNFLITNPEVLQITFANHGHNLLRGINHFLEDLNLWHGYINFKKTNIHGFKLGKTIAYTPGKIVYQNEIMQLIQYSPTTTEVYRYPLLIVTSWINKYYLFDLRAKNSLVKWLAAQGFTVFIISWFNPTEKFPQQGFTEYLTQGPVKAIDVINQITNETQINLLGYCLGGTLLACTTAYLAAKQDSRIHSATYIATLLDYSAPGELGNFMGEEQINFFEETMRDTGYWDGRKMATAFNLVAANELIWPYFINHYLKGKKPVLLDALYWAIDLTNTPASLYSFYMRSLHLHNQLKIPSAIRVADTPIDFRQITTPLYYLAFQEDITAPWQSCYDSAQLHTCETRFVLAGGDHFTGVAHPQSTARFSFWANPLQASQSASAWHANAVEQRGSWWYDWLQWISPYAGDKVPARTPGTKHFPAIEEAPGSYVRVQLFE